jgi:hypothetical protein
MTWMMPVQCPPFAGLLALVFAWPRLRQPTSSLRLVVEVFLITLVTVAGWAAVWAPYWWLEQRS